MLPSPELNIYPKTPENLNALLEFYFNQYNIPFDDAVEKLINTRNLKLNQIEFIARKLSEAWIPIFKKFLINNPSLSNLLRYGIDTLNKPISEWTHIKSQREIMSKFLQFVQETEVDFEKLKRNN